jgi:hypothetical protein
MNSLPISRRDLCRSALVGSSWLAAGGLAGRAWASTHAVPTNVRVSHDGYDDHTSPCLAVDPRDPRHLLAASMLTRGVVATYVSFDGGRSWRSNGPLPLPAGFDGGGDLSAGFDGDGRAFVCGLLTEPPSPSSKGTGRSVHVWRSENGGRSFARSVAVSGIGALDGPWLAVDRRRPQALHVVWAEGTTPGFTTGLSYARSTDGGRTFEAPRLIASGSRGLDDLRVACGPPEGVYMIYDVGRAAVGEGSRATVTVLCSRDGGRTFDRPIELGRDTLKISFPGTYSLSLPAIAADSDGSLVCAAFSSRDTATHRSEIRVATSRDQGRTWSRAKAVTPRNHVDYFEPQVAIDAAGRIGVMAFAMARARVSVVLMLCEPGSVRFGPPVTITEKPFDPADSGFGKRWWIGDYQALATTPGAFHPLWNDTRTGRLQLYTAAVRVS